jgi:pyruvate/2-oxoglutarate/acetoin dehydrogenase E1 component/TPP-dependent pyruvate/acetoin dehydrogenase alpha subunit
MVVGRRLDAQALALSRQGRIAAFPSSLGQEACQAGVALALQAEDWLFPTYRDSTALITRGVDPVDVLAPVRGHRHCGYDPFRARCAPMTTPLATHAPHAAGLAAAARRRAESAVAVALLGDGATSEGDFHEAVNLAAVFAAPAVFVVQNNRYAISVGVGRQCVAPSLAHKGVGYGMPGELVDGNDALAVLAVLDRALARARAGDGPTLVELLTYRMSPHTSSDDPRRYRSGEETEGWRARDPVTRLGRYLRRHGLLDAATEREVAAEAEERAADLRTRIASEETPRPLGTLEALEVLEVLETAYALPPAQLAEQRAWLLTELGPDGPDGPDGWAGGMPDGAAPAAVPVPRCTAFTVDGFAAAGELRRAPGAVVECVGGTGATMADALRAALRDAMAADDRVLVLGADVGALGGVFRITDGLAAAFGRDRCFDTPVAEAGIVGFAVGLAMYGFRPVAELQFDAFAYPAFEQIASHVAKMGARTGGRVRLPLVLRIPYGGGVGAVEHHSDSSEAYYAHTAGLKVVTPSTAADAYALLRAAVDDPDPVVFLEPKLLYRHRSAIVPPKVSPNVPLERAEPLGRAVVRRPGRDVTLVAYGPTVPLALEAAEVARGRGRDVEVVDLRGLVPFDDATVVASVRRTGRCVVVHEAQEFAGVGAEIAARVQERCFHSLAAPVLRVTGLDVPYPPPRLERYHRPHVGRIMSALDRLQWDDRPDPRWIDRWADGSAASGRGGTER